MVFMASKTDEEEEEEAVEDFVTLRCTDLSCALDGRDNILISTRDINSWDLTSILAHQFVKIEAKRNRLIENSAYFRGLLSGSYSDSFKDLITVHWNLESFLSTLRCMFGCPVDVTLDKFVILYEAGFFFGVEMLLSKCQDWFREISSSKGLHQPQLDLGSLINIWQYGLEHDVLIQQSCVSYLAKNFMWAMSYDSFTDIPHPLFLSMIQHPDLTIDSEKHLCQGILIWLDANDQLAGHISSSKDYCHGLLMQVRFSLLPLWFVTGKQRCCLFPQFADEGLEFILGLASNPSAALTIICGAEGCSQLRLRFTEYTKRLDLSCHPNIWPFLLVSMASSLQAEDTVLRKRAMFSLDKLQHQHVTGFKSLSSWVLSQTLSFGTVDEVDISNCPRLDLEDALECFSKSFPSLRKLRAAHFIGFDAKRFAHVVKKWSSLCDIDLTVDISPVIPSKISITSSLSEYASQRSSLLSDSGHNTFQDLYFSRKNRHLLHITKLTLEGRTDIFDSGLKVIAFLCTSLCYLNLNGCISVTDVGISFVITTCCKLHSISVSDTSFGDNSVHALCRGGTELDVEYEEAKASQPFAAKFETLHIGGCKGVSETSISMAISRCFMLKHLCLRETNVSESAFCNFLGSSLETLDISETKVSLPFLVGLVDRNPNLKRLMARGCRNLSHTSRHLFSEIANSFKLEEIEIGWGLLPYSAKALQSSMKSLRKIVIGLGGSLGEEGLQLIPSCCPLLETLVLYFQEISDALILNVLRNSKHLRNFVISYGFGGISSLSLNFNLPSLKTLKLERVTTWMTNTDLITLTESCPNLTELSLIGCRHLNPESQNIIASGWPGLISLKLEECGKDLTRNGVSCLMNCRALEDLVLRHTGPGLPKHIIASASSQLPMLRKLSLDMCDAKDGGFDVPRFSDRVFLSSVKIARCKSSNCFVELYGLDVRKTPVHKETMILVWNSEKLSRVIAKERL